MKFTIKKQEPMRISFSMKNASNTNEPVVSKDAIVDVDVLPIENIDASIFYRIGIEKPASISFMAGGAAISEEELSMNFTIVDTLPENVATADADTGYINIFIRTDRTGWVYVDEYFAPEIGLDKGWYTLEEAGLPSEIVSSPEEAQNPDPEFLYIIYEEAICEYKLYYYTDRWQEVGGPIDTSIIPTKTSELENDSQYITIPELEEEYVKKTDRATTGGDYGLVKITDVNAGGITRTLDGGLAIAGADETDIDAKENSRKPITPRELDYAIKVGMTTNTETWSEDTKEIQDGKEVIIKGDKTKARELIGAVGFTDYAGEGKAGLMKTSNTQGGCTVLDDGTLYFFGIQDGEWASRGTDYASSRHLRLSHVDKIVKYGLTDNKTPLTADEQASAQKWLGIDTLIGDIETAIDNIIALQNSYIGGES